MKMLTGPYTRYQERERERVRARARDRERALLGIFRNERNHIRKILYTVTLYSKYTRPLTLQNFCSARYERNKRQKSMTEVHFCFVL
jgi:hypothetical protein